MKTEEKKKCAIYWLKVGDVIRLGDYCWDHRSPLPVKNIGSDREFSLSKNHHPHYRIIPKPEYKKNGHW